MYIRGQPHLNNTPFVQTGFFITSIFTTLFLHNRTCVHPLLYNPLCTTPKYKTTIFFTNPLSNLQQPVYNPRFISTQLCNLFCTTLTFTTTTFTTTEFLQPQDYNYIRTVTLNLNLTLQSYWHTGSAIQAHRGIDNRKI